MYVLVLCLLVVAMAAAASIPWIKRPPARVWSYVPRGDAKTLKDEVVICDHTLHGYLRISPEILRAPIFSPHRAALVMLHALEEGGVWWDRKGTRPTLEGWKGAWEYGEGAGWCAAQRGSAFVRRWRLEFEEMLRYPSVEDYVRDRGKVVDLSGVADPLGHPELVAREKILQYDRYPRESLGL
jgi:hypothetical protein